MTPQKLLHNIRERLLPLLGDFALPDAEVIIERCLDISRTRLYTDRSVNIDDDDLARINAVVERRLTGEPLPYIFGKTYFYDRDFFVDTNVLIPRPDTEVLIETILDTERNDRANFVDIGTGSGIIPAVLTAHRPGWSAVAADISYAALRVASKNLRGDDLLTNGNAPLLICGDMLTAIKPDRQFDFIVSNPPYISSSQLKTLDKSVIDHEPRTALHGGNDGLDYYRMISIHAKNYIKDTGRVYLEINYDQGASVTKIFRDGGWRDITVKKDMGGRDRVVAVM